MSEGRAGKPWREWLGAVPIAHRGLHDATAGRAENALSAFAAAIARGYAIEMDVRLAADGEVVVFHDATLQRLTGQPGTVADTSRTALARLQLAGSRDHIPGLGEVLDLVGGRVPLYLDLKGNGSDDGRLAEAVTELLHPYPGPVAMMSLAPAILKKVRKANESRPIGLVSYRYNDEWARDHLEPYQRTARRHLFPAVSVGIDFVAYDIAGLPAVAPLLLRWVFGVPLLTWTVRSAEERKRAVRWADQMIFEGFDPQGAPPRLNRAAGRPHLRLVPPEPRQ